MDEFEKIISKIKDNNLFNKDFLSTHQNTLQDIENIINISEALRYLTKNGISSKCFKSGKAVLNLRDDCLRTEYLFYSACNLIGLEVQKFAENKFKYVHGETAREMLNLISPFAQIIGICDFTQVGAGQSYMSEAGKILDESTINGYLFNRPSIINLLGDIDNPVQTLADLQHLKNYFGGYDNLKGKKLALSWAYSSNCGKPLSFPQGILSLMTKSGMNVSLAYPPGYNLMPDIIELAKKNVMSNHCTLEITDSMGDAVNDADIVCPLYWDPFSVYIARSELLTYNDVESLSELEKECKLTNEKYSDWECNEDILKMTRRGEAVLTHHLPLEISGITCRRGEIQDRVYEKFKAELYREESFIPYIIASLILLCRVENPVGIIKELRN
jgi:knotted carbamoyltransferase YgeW